MEMKERTRELGDLLLEFYDETKKCIKRAETEKDRLHVRALLNALASYHGDLEECYKHPEYIEEVKHE